MSGPGIITAIGHAGAMYHLSDIADVTRLLNVITPDCTTFEQRGDVIHVDHVATPDCTTEAYQITLTHSDALHYLEDTLGVSFTEPTSEDTITA